MTTIYDNLSFDPFSVAHRLDMPATLFEAFKKSMLGGLRGKKTTLLDYNEAIYCITRFQNDYRDHLVSLPVCEEENEGFISEVIESYATLHQLQCMPGSYRMGTSSSYITHAFNAATEILELFRDRHLDIFKLANQDRSVITYRLDYVVKHLRDAIVELNKPPVDYPQ